MKNKTKAKINKHVHDNEMMNADLMMTMMAVVVMANDDVIDYHYVNHDDVLDHVHDLLHDLLNVDFVVDIV